MKRLFLYITLILLGYSCSDNILDKEPLDIISDATVWNDAELIDQYLTECYAEVAPYLDQSYLFKNTKVVLQENVMLGIADEADSRWNKTSKPNDISVEGLGYLDWWGYETVRRLNYLIEEIDDSPVTDKIEYAAEARFLRAFCYFNMVKRYGGVPLILNVQSLTDSEEELYPERDSEDDVYQFIIDELDDIIDNDQLPTQAVESGRAYLYAALALKSRAAMYAASIATWGTVQLDGLVGIPEEKKDYYWQASYNASKKIIEDNQFALYDANSDKSDNYRELFLTEDNCEVIYAECFTGSSGKNHSWDMWQSPASYNAWGGGQQNCVYLEMVESYGNTDGTSGIIDRDKIESGYLWTMEELFGKKDPRFKASIYTQGTPWIGDTLDYHNGIIKEDGTVTTQAYNEVDGRGVCAVAVGSKSFGILKYLDESIAIVGGPRRSSTDWMVFRLGEIYLNLAEAAFELDKEDEALEAVNKIRDRAGMPEYTSITRDNIRDERKIELAFEANRFWDLRRWRTAVSDLTREYTGLRYILDYETRKYKLELVSNITGDPSPKFEEKHYYYPITLPRTSVNRNLVENLGYE